MFGTSDARTDQLGEEMDDSTERKLFATEVAECSYAHWQKNIPAVPEA